MANEADGPSPQYVDLSHLKGGNALVELQRVLPEELLRQLRNRLPPGERVLFSFPVDMNLLGDYAREWLVLTERNCVTWTEDEHGFRERRSFALGDLRGARLRELRGNHILVVDVGDGWEELVRSSNLTAWKLKPAVQALEKVAADGVDVLADIRQVELKLPGRQVCPTCGRIIRPRLGICLACLNKRQMFLRMLKLILPYKLAAAAAMLLLAGTIGLQLTRPLIAKGITDLVYVPVVQPDKAPLESFWYRFGPAGSINLLLTFGALLLIMILLPSLVGAARRYVSSWLGNRISMDLSNRVFAHMMRLSLSFYHREETGGAMSRITRDVGRIHMFLSWNVQMILADVFTIFFIVIIMLNLHWRLALIVLTPVPILVVVSEVARRKVHGLYNVLWRRYAAMSRFLADRIPGVRVVKAFAQTGREAHRFEGITGRVFSHEMKVAKIRAILEPIVRMATGMGHILVFVCGGLLLIWGRGAQGELTIGDIVAFSSLMHMFYMPVMDLAHMLPEFERAATSADRVFEVLDSEPELDSDDRTVEMPPITGKVEFRDVTFGYEPEEPVLKEVGFVVEPGEMIGLVGHSGAGKTTLINLVCHFFKTDEGQVLIDDVDIMTVKVEGLRRQIGIVSQEPFLFSGTVAENIAYGKAGATEHEIIAAAKAANAHEFILGFPEGYDTLVGERGTRISGGERQRIAIARAILKDPRILILDEATSSVDTETEEKIQEALRRLVRGRTTFAIAHRLSTLKFADRLFVLEKGRLVESGTHEDLLASGGVYARLCEKQTELSRLTAWEE